MIKSYDVNKNGQIPKSEMRKFALNTLFVGFLTKKDAPRDGIVAAS